MNALVCPFLEPSGASQDGDQPAHCVSRQENRDAEPKEEENSRADSCHPENGPVKTLEPTRTRASWCKLQRAWALSELDPLGPPCTRSRPKTGSERVQFVWEVWGWQKEGREVVQRRGGS